MIHAGTRNATGGRRTSRGARRKRPASVEGAGMPSASAGGLQLRYEARARGADALLDLLSDQALRSPFPPG